MLVLQRRLLVDKKERKMFDEIEEELKDEQERGHKAARDLIEHLKAMGAKNCSMPIETEDGCYIVEVRKTL